MHLNAQKPIFVPFEHWAEVEKLSKAALMDMVWDYAMQISEGGYEDTRALDEFRQRREIILTHRKQQLTHK